MSCQQQTQLVVVLTATLIGLNVTTLAAFYGWRRARAPWRTMLFTIFVICGLIVLDFFILAIAPTSATPHACK